MLQEATSGANCMPAQRPEGGQIQKAMTFGGLARIGGWHAVAALACCCSRTTTSPVPPEARAPVPIATANAQPVGSTVRALATTLPERFVVALQSLDTRILLLDLAVERFDRRER